MDHEGNKFFVAFGFQKISLSGNDRIPVRAMAVHLAALQGEMNRRRPGIPAYDLESGAEHFVEHQRKVDAVRARGGAAHLDGFVRFDNLIECLESRESHDRANRNSLARSADPA